MLGSAERGGVVGTSTMGGASDETGSTDVSMAGEEPDVEAGVGDGVLSGAGDVPSRGTVTQALATRPTARRIASARRRGGPEWICDRLR